MKSLFGVFECEERNNVMPAKRKLLGPVVGKGARCAGPISINECVGDLAIIDDGYPLADRRLLRGAAVREPDYMSKWITSA